MPVLEGVKVHNPQPNVAVVELIGEHDLVERADLQELLEVLLTDNGLVVIDVSQTTFIDSSVIHVLTEARKFSHQCGTCLRLQMGTAPIVKECLEICGILDLFDVAHNRKEALATTAGVRF
jgi:anti-anti-sigma factor